MINVLFVCLGNICRSPMAEGVFQKMVNDAGLSDRIRVDSAGTGGWHVGETAHRGTLDVLKRHNIAYDGRARQFAREDFDRFQYILAMDRSNYNALLRMLPGERPDAHGILTLPSGTQVTMFLGFANRAGLTQTQDVPDPYYDGRFDEVYALVNDGAQALLDHIRQAHDLA